jgi:hypothetical protein
MSACQAVSAAAGEGDIKDGDETTETGEREKVAGG